MTTDYNSLITQLEDYFCNLLIIQYRQAPKNRALIKMLVDLVFANNLFSKIYDLTVNVEDSIGAQLDVVGRWIGITRYYAGDSVISENRFSLTNYSNIKTSSYYPYQGGFSNYTNFSSLDGGILTYKELRDRQASLNKMGDKVFREIIKLKIYKNNINFTRKNIDNAIYNWSNGLIYTTWDKMEITYHYPKSKYEIMQIAKEKNVLLKPCGCSLELVQES